MLCVAVSVAVNGVVSGAVYVAECAAMRVAACVAACVAVCVAVCVAACVDVRACCSREIVGHLSVSGLFSGPGGEWCVLQRVLQSVL